MRRGLTLALLALACAGSAWADDEGLASWYGPRFHGRRTASGATFDMHALTAAHRTLPFGTRVLVRNLVTGKEVEVRITDRGPHLKQRIIDLSQAAARAIGMARGVAKVRVTVLDAEGARQAADPPALE